MDGGEGGRLLFLPLQATPFLAAGGKPSNGLHPWSEAYLCRRQVLRLQTWQVLVLEKVSASRQRFTGHLAFLFLAGSQDPELLCRSRTAAASSPAIFSMDMEQSSHTTTIRLCCSPLGQSWPLYVLCSKQKTWRKVVTRVHQIGNRRGNFFFVWRKWRI